MSNAVAVILAAGRGKRLGNAAKAVLRLGDETTYLEAVQNAAGAGGVTRFVVVTGPPHDAACDREATRLGMPVAHNPAPDRGMASSVAAGFAHAIEHATDARAALLWPVDHPRVTTRTVRAVLARATADNIVIPVFNGRGGHPTAFGCNLWPELAACTAAPQGARSVIRADPARVVHIPVNDPGVIADVDTPADREHLESFGPKTDTLPDTGP